MINILYKNYNGTKEYLLTALVKPKSKIHKVLLSYFLARFYCETGQREKAKEYLDFIINEGNKLVYVGLAKQLQASAQQPAQPTAIEKARTG